MNPEHHTKEAIDAEVDRTPPLEEREHTVWQQRQDQKRHQRKAKRVLLRVPPVTKVQLRRRKS